MDFIDSEYRSVTSRLLSDEYLGRNNRGVGAADVAKRDARDREASGVSGAKTLGADGGGGGRYTDGNEGEAGSSFHIEEKDYYILRNEVQRLGAEKADIQRTLAYRNAEVESLRLKNKKLVDELEMAQARIATAQALVSTVKEQQNLTRSYKKELERTRVELRNIATRTNRAAALEKKPARQNPQVNESMKRQLASTRNSNVSLRERVRQLQRDLEERDKDVDDLKRRVSELRNRTVGQRNHIAYLKDKLEGDGTPARTSSLRLRRAERTPKSDIKPSRNLGKRNQNQNRQQKRGEEKITMKEHERILEELRRDIELEAAAALVASQDSLKADFEETILQREHAFREKERSVRGEMKLLKQTMQDLLASTQEQLEDFRPVQTPVANSTRGAVPEDDEVARPIPFLKEDSASGQVEGVNDAGYDDKRPYSNQGPEDAY